MRVESIKSRKYGKTFFKVGFDNKQELDDTKDALAHFKEVYIKNDDPVSSSIELFDILSSALGKAETDENGRICIILYDVKLILCFFFIFFQLWSEFEQRTSLLEGMLEKINDLHKKRETLLSEK